MRSRKLSFTISIALLFSATVMVRALAQEVPKGKKSPQVETDVLIEGAPPMMFNLPVPVPGEAGGLFKSEVNFGWIASEMSFGGKLVKDSPYSAEAVTETTQTLSDGNRIQHKNSASVYRDSDGRTRRDQTLSAIGPWAAAGDPPQTIFINDPVAGVNFVLNPKDKTARKLPQPSFVSKGKVEQRPPAGATRRVETNEPAVYSPTAEARLAEPAGSDRMVGALSRLGVAIEGVHLNENGPKPETELLGKRVIEGVEAEGTRTTITIPAGQIGNELPINIVSERWFSPELEVVVLSRQNDPRMGETVYRLTAISRSEQPASLFEVPADYTIKEGEIDPFFLKRAVPLPRKPEGNGN
ncbi:MAG TPA: hypothetical protein VHP35_13730 [Terriglobia bacterium]|jgi:hypothetical protein|nr:hypothetical protein [Terriglobia bacterium]